MGVSKAQAGRVIMTESAVFANKARQDCMGKLGVEQFEVIETLDEQEPVIHAVEWTSSTFQ